MVLQMLAFERRYFFQQPLTYILMAAYLIAGFLAGFSSSISFPNVNKNSPYEISYMLGILSLLAIFSCTLLIAQHFLREHDNNFLAFIRTSPVDVRTYSFIRLVVMALVCFTVFVPAVVGLYIGNLFSEMPSDRMGPFEWSSYIRPLIIISLPNIIITTCILCSTAWLLRSRLMIYVSGLLLYVVYLIGSIFSNSPLIAGSIPLSPEDVDIFSILDPFGLAAFFQQTTYWTAFQRNILNVELGGNLLLNRIFWLALGASFVGTSYLFFVRTPFSKRIKKQPVVTHNTSDGAYQAVTTELGKQQDYVMLVLLTAMRSQLKTVFKSTPIVIATIAFIVFLGIELNSAIGGDPRTGFNYATTGVIVSSLLESLPSISFLLLLFYCGDLYYKSKTFRFSYIEDCCPLLPGLFPVTVILTMMVIIVTMIGLSIIIGIAFQVVNGYTAIEWRLYFSLFYFAGLPLLVAATIIVAVQVLFNSSYVSMFVAGIVICFTSTSIASLIGIVHPLAGFGKIFSREYSEMNGFGNYLQAFHWKMILATSVALLLFSVAIRKKMRLKNFFQVPHSSLIVTGVLISFIIVTALYITGAGRNGKEAGAPDWKEGYERKYRRFQGIHQPTISFVKATITLLPRENRYLVSGSYKLVNNGVRSIDSVLLYIPVESSPRHVELQNGRLIKSDDTYNHYWYELNRPLAIGDTTEMKFSFSSSWSPLKGHVPFNSIIENGSFIRISRYFPVFGYQQENEITNRIERTKRRMEPQSKLPSIDMPIQNPYNYEFTNVDLTISTQEDQIVIAPGTLAAQWKSDGRAFFRYVSERPMPFRFAVSSARYAVVKVAYRNIPIEIYHDRAHAANAGQLIANAARTLEYMEKNFSTYPHRVVRFAEVSSFAEGFAATAYPGVIYMKENGGFYSRLDKSQRQDVINQLAGHELSHQWWGCDALHADQREGAWILSETLANYTALMLYRQQYGDSAISPIVRMHHEIYLSQRAFSNETSLIKTTYETPHLAYNKGLVVMYQVKELMGESNVNDALKMLFQLHAYPNTPPTARDLVKVLKRCSPPGLHARIDTLFTTTGTDFVSRYR